jgi:hypothetical protein
MPTLIGYSAQGFGKFGFYEIFKDVYRGAVGPDNAAKYQTIGFAVSSASAEVIADCLLCPWEAVSNTPMSFNFCFKMINKVINNNPFYSSRSECRLPSPASSPPTPSPDSTRSRLQRELTDSTRDSPLSGVDRFPIPS